LLTNRFHYGNNCRMPLPIRKTIEHLKLSKVAKEMGVPVSTVFRWKEADTIPGCDDPKSDWRYRHFEQVALRLLQDNPLPE